MSDTSPWPRLLACWNGSMLTMVHQHADGRRAFASEQPVAHADLLEQALARGLACGLRPLCHAALVAPGSLAVGGLGDLRRRLGLQALLVLARDQALGLALPTLDQATLARLMPGPLAAPALLCRLGERTQLVAADGLPPAALMGLLQHPLSAMNADEALLLDDARHEGRLLRLGQLLGPRGIVFAYLALARAERRPLTPVPTAEFLLARAPDDALARRACTLACAAVATLCGQLALAGVRSVVLCGSAVPMHRALQDYAWMPRLTLLLGHEAPLPAIAVWDSEASHQPCLDGAAHALDQQWQDHGPQGTDDVSALVRSSYGRLSRTERRVADLVLADAAEVLRTPTAGLARNAGISQPQVIRFCRSLGFEGVKTFRRALGASLALQPGRWRAAGPTAGVEQSAGAVLGPASEARVQGHPE